MAGRYDGRQIVWPWKDIFYFATTLTLIAIAAVIAAVIFVENSNLKDRISDNEKAIAAIPGLLEELKNTICDKIDALGEELGERLDALEDRLEEVEDVIGGGPFQPLDEKAQPDGYCPLDGNATVPPFHIPPQFMEAAGCWDADTNTPGLGSGGCEEGNFYVVIVPGSTNLDGTDDWVVGDALVCVGGDFWKRVGSRQELDDLIDVNTLGQSSGDALVFDGSLWLPDPSCCGGFADQGIRVKRGGGTVVVSNNETNTKMRFEIELEDPGGNYDNAVDFDYEAPLRAFYGATVSIVWPEPTIVRTNWAVRARLVLNGSPITFQQTFLGDANNILGTPSASDTSTLVLGFFRMNAGDKLHVEVGQFNSNNQVAQTGSKFDSSTFTVVLHGLV